MSGPLLDSMPNILSPNKHYLLVKSSEVIVNYECLEIKEIELRRRTTYVSAPNTDMTPSKLSERTIQFS
jgi:hypothetical protein